FSFGFAAFFFFVVFGGFTAAAPALIVVPPLLINSACQASTCLLTYQPLSYCPCACLCVFRILI
ncbi:hypothetical protein, partial [Hydrogeniiclostridium mannosilyticum]|uniref:hypothetical protein n=1 Tax=Hydrogeniiclostridium mannosilyticum TaxID=2764322 RepID=UPI001C0A6F29